MTEVDDLLRELTELRKPLAVELVRLRHAHEPRHELRHAQELVAAAESDSERLEPIVARLLTQHGYRRKGALDYLSEFGPEPVDELSVARLRSRSAYRRDPAA